MTEPAATDRWLVYGVIRIDESVLALPLDPGLRGAFGQTCTVLAAPPLAAVVGSLSTDTACAQPATADLVAYAKVIAHVHAQQTIVPLRFGGVLAGEAAVRAHLIENTGAYQTLLARLDGTEELAVRLVLPPPAPVASLAPAASATAAGAGAAYLRVRQARYAQAERQRAAAQSRAEWLCAALMPHALAHHIETISERAADQEQMTIAAAFLIQRGQAASLRARVHELAFAESIGLSVSGPFPPYSFAKLSAPD